MPVNAKSSQPSGSAQARKNSSMMLIVGVVVALVIIAGAFYLISSSAHTSKYLRLAALLAGGKKVSITQVANVLNVSLTSFAAQNNSTSKSKDMNSTYFGNGSITFDESGTTISAPFTYNFSGEENGTYSRSSYSINLADSNDIATVISTPNATFNCKNLNSTTSLVSGLSGLGGSGYSVSPDYKCEASAPISASSSLLGSSGLGTVTSNSIAKIISFFANSTYINATSVRYATLEGSSSVCVSGAMSSNQLNAYQLYSLMFESSSSAYSLFNATVVDTVKIVYGGPYALCLNTVSGSLYNFSFSPKVSITYPSNLIYTFVPSTGNTTISFGFAINGKEGHAGPVPSKAELATPPYPVINGTCNGFGFDIFFPNLINGVDLPYTCSTVNMNRSGYLRLNLVPAQSGSSGAGYIGIFNNDSSTGESRILGLSCFGYSGLSPTAMYNNSNFESENSTYYQPVNITFNSTQDLALVFKCPGSNAGEEYSGELYGVMLENESIYGYNSTVIYGLHNTSFILSGFQVYPTISGSMGRNADTGPVSSVNIYTYNYT
jgi:hypothetical protein